MTRDVKTEHDPLWTYFSVLRSNPGGANRADLPRCQHDDSTRAKPWHPTLSRSAPLFLIVV
jgi:hypothetical protein